MLVHNDPRDKKKFSKIKTFSDHAIIIIYNHHIFDNGDHKLMEIEKPILHFSITNIFVKLQIIPDKYSLNKMR
ncbi:hypothetical protein BpHYR1_053246 [Brachionus plicatilis]|uniref:Uncharacterized protein n=1 Tax=Brachionus plicatilis TaxID=10195 RepID=A0A3M7T0I2_BRAPC|nr:hypothetical protein BpHYR1_053246 [Brachionus plicatilis]